MIAASVSSVPGLVDSGLLSAHLPRQRRPSPPPGEGRGKQNKTHRLPNSEVLERGDQCLHESGRCELDQPDEPGEDGKDMGEVEDDVGRLEPGPAVVRHAEKSSESRAYAVMTSLVQALKTRWSCTSAPAATSSSRRCIILAMRSCRMGSSRRMLATEKNEFSPLRRIQWVSCFTVETIEYRAMEGEQLRNGLVGR